MSDIHKIGTEAVRALKALTRAKADKKAKTAKATELIEERNELARPLLQQVHDAIAAGQSVNGQSTWNGWAKHAGWSKRALDYILNGRKPQTGNSSSRFKLILFDFSYYSRRKEEKSVAMWADFDVVGSDGVVTSGAAMKLRVRVPGENTRDTYDAAVKKMIGLMKQAHLWDKETAATFKEWLEEYFEEVKPKNEEPLLHKPASVDSNFSRCGLSLDGLHYTFNRPTCPECRKGKKKKAVSPQFNKRELRAYSTLKALLDATVKGFENGTISAGEWRATVKELDGKNTGRSVFRARHGRYVHFMDEVRERMEAAIRDAKTQEQHTGQHEDCPECWDYQQKQEQLEAKRTAAWQAWSKRIQTLINTWRSHRLKDENEYREKFEAASEKYLKRLKREGIEKFDGEGESIVKEARGRMEGAIADRNRLRPYLSTTEVPDVLSDDNCPTESTVDAQAMLETGRHVRESEAVDPNEGDEEVL